MFAHVLRVTSKAHATERRGLARNVLATDSKARVESRATGLQADGDDCCAVFASARLRATLTIFCSAFARPSIEAATSAEAVCPKGRPLEPSARLSTRLAALALRGSAAPTGQQASASTVASAAARADASATDFSPSRGQVIELLRRSVSELQASQVQPTNTRLIWAYSPIVLSWLLLQVLRGLVRRVSCRPVGATRGGLTRELLAQVYAELPGVPERRKASFQVYCPTLLVAKCVQL